MRLIDMDDVLNIVDDLRDRMTVEGYWSVVERVKALPSVQPDNRLEKIADLVEGTIDHFDLDDAMDLLYQIKGVLKDGRVNKPTGGD